MTTFHAIRGDGSTRPPPEPSPPKDEEVVWELRIDGGFLWLVTEGYKVLRFEPDGSISPVKFVTRRGLKILPGSKSIVVNSPVHL